MKSKTFVILSALSIIINKASSVSTKCWFDESRSRNRCCSSTTIEAEYADEDGHLWAYEDGDLCSIPEPKCFASLTGDYSCCEDVQETSYIDADGEWGAVNGEWCGRKMKRRWNDRSVRGETIKEWRKFKTTFNNEIYPANDNPRIISDVNFDYRLQLSMNVGADESELRFGWYSFSSYVPKIRILDITSKIPKNTRYVSDYSDILDINDFEKEMEKAEVFTGIAINHKIMNNKRIFSRE